MKFILIATISFLLFTSSAFAQNDIFNKIKDRTQSIGAQKTGSNKSDSTVLGFEHYDPKKDSIAISYKYLDSVRSIPLDSTLNDFDKYFSVPSNYQALGNNGAAAYPFMYAPVMKPGWDAGHHAFDLYGFTLEESKFYKTNRPFSRLSYQIASGKEQMIKIFHTQNPRPNWGFGFDYRLISAPGFFVTQNTNHKSFRVFSNYQGRHKRYAAALIMMGNTIKNSENGGIKYDSLLSDVNHKKRYSVPVNLGNASLYEPNPFNASVTTGNINKDFTFFVRQSYDIGKRDSVAINDSTNEYLFYPKLRIQHSFTYNTYRYLYRDFLADSTIYEQWYDTTLRRKIDSFEVHENWKIITNDISLIQFPDTRNQSEFILAGARLENIMGELKNGNTTQYNLILHGEYRNKTRNKLWEILAKGEYYLNGFNHGDYAINAAIGRAFDKRFGFVKVFFNNVNRTPSFIFNSASSYNFTNTSLTKKENIISFGAESNNSFINLGFKNFLINNLSYFTDYYHGAQYSKTINLIQVYGSKKIKITKKVNWYAEAAVQQTDGAAPVRVPLVFTRNRVAFEAHYFKNLDLSTGLEIRYYTPYDGYNYSPVMGSFFPQDTFKLRNLPDVTAFFHFRIKSFTGFIRADNLNTASFKNGFDFTNNNFAAPHYPTPGLILRFGIQWGFVN